MEWKGPTLYVVARYYEDRAYGGPEEGGWWYTYGELEKVVLATRDEDKAYDAAWRLNTAARAQQRHGWNTRTAYHVVYLPRYELIGEEWCHSPYEPTPEDYELRYDIPTYFPVGRAHYC